MLRSFCPSLDLLRSDLPLSLTEVGAIRARGSPDLGAEGLDGELGALVWASQFHMGIIPSPAKQPAWRGAHPALGGSWQQSDACFWSDLAGRWKRVLVPDEEKLLISANTAEGGIASSDVKGLKGGKRDDEIARDGCRLFRAPTNPDPPPA